MQQQKKVAELQQTILASLNHLCEMESAYFDPDNYMFIFPSEEEKDQHIEECLQLSFQIIDARKQVLLITANAQDEADA